MRDTIFHLEKTDQGSLDRSLTLLLDDEELLVFVELIRRGESKQRSPMAAGLRLDVDDVEALIEALGIAHRKMKSARRKRLYGA